MGLILRELNLNDETRFLEGLSDWDKQELSWYTFIWKPGLSHVDHLQKLADQKNKDKISSEHVPSTMLYAFFDDKIIGRFNIRHELNDQLIKRGGHIGYAVSPKYRNQGFASEIFQLGMKHCQEIGLDRILITCSNQNKYSWKIIEKFGGALENRKFDSDKSELIRRYWLNTDFNLFQRMKVSKKVTAYITRMKDNNFEILVFKHDAKYADAGLQVPGGSVEKNESLKEALIREIKEETGLLHFEIKSKIDRYQFYSPYSKKYIRRSVFHVELTESSKEQWTHVVQSEGKDSGRNFHFFWMKLTDVQNQLVNRLDESIRFLPHSKSIDFL